MKGSQWMMVAGTGALLGSAAVAGTAWPRYRLDMAAAQKRLQGRSRVVATAHGLVEFAECGQGRPLVVVHGATGGFDQALLLAEALSTDYRLIAPSRFGYLRTGLPRDCGPRDQADAHAALLDALQIERVAVAGASAGAFSAVQFAVRHADRCAALVLISAVTDVILSRAPLLGAALRVVTASDFMYWLALQYTQRIRQWSFGLSAQVVANLGPADQAWLDRFTETTLPLSWRRQGVLQDLACCSHAEVANLEQVVAPVLLIHAADDRLVPAATAVMASRRIPNARLLLLPDGGHLLLGQHARARAEVMAFLQTYYMTEER